MPQNRFSDSVEKRQLRRRDLRQIQEFCKSRGLTAGAAYFGMPSVEFLDVREWRSTLRSVFAVEYDSDVLSDMKTNLDLLGLTLPVEFCEGDVLDVLMNHNACYDVYNCDFYGGFIYQPGKQMARSRSTEAIRSLVERHRRQQRSFLFITTFNVRDTGAVEYTEFIDQVEQALGSSPSISKACVDHRKTRARELKLCFPFFCWNVGSAANFNVTTHEAVVYTNSPSTMVHFVTSFAYDVRALPSLNSLEKLKDVVYMPLMKMNGLVREVDYAPKHRP